MFSFSSFLLLGGHQISVRRILASESTGGFSGKYTETVML